MEAAGAVDAQNAPTAPWKTHRTRFPQLPQAVLLVLNSTREEKQNGTRPRRIGVISAVRCERGGAPACGRRRGSSEGTENTSTQNSTACFLPPHSIHTARSARRHRCRELRTSLDPPCSPCAPC